MSIDHPPPPPSPRGRRKTVGPIGPRSLVLLTHLPHQLVSFFLFFLLSWLLGDGVRPNAARVPLLPADLVLGRWTNHHPFFFFSSRLPPNPAVVVGFSANGRICLAISAKEPPAFSLSLRFSLPLLAFSVSERESAPASPSPRRGRPLFSFLGCHARSRRAEKADDDNSSADAACPGMPIDYYTGSPRRPSREGPIGPEPIDKGPPRFQPPCACTTRARALSLITTLYGVITNYRVLRTADPRLCLSALLLPRMQEPLVRPRGIAVEYPWCCERKQKFFLSF